MGGVITIDKHATQLNDWLSISDKLDQVLFETTITTHLAVWKVDHDENSQIGNKTAAVTLNETIIFQEESSYVIELIVRENLQKIQNIDYSIKQTLLTILRNVQKNSYEACITEGKINQVRYYTYAFLGKSSKSEIKLAAVHYALKLGQFINTQQKLKILSGGGVYKNNKLHMGSLLHFCENIVPDKNHRLPQFYKIHLFKQLVLHQNPESLEILKLKPKKQIPILIKASSLNQNVIKEKLNLEIPGLKMNSKVHSKPLTLKLDLKQFQEVTYEQIQKEQTDDKLKFDIRATARHELQMEKFSKDCTKIIDKLYVSGDKVAQDEAVLKEFKITKIVNCAGDYCSNYFQNNKNYTYLTFFLKDSQTQNIQCLFYRVIDFINEAHSKNQNVLVHCIQGISRSVSFVIAYLIFMNGFDYKKAQNFVKTQRRIACPNNGFMVQLIQFYKRLYEKYDSLPIPRIFLISSHCSQTPTIITARLLKYPLFDHKKFLGLDSRGMYIIQCEDVMYLWVGNKCEQENRLKLYWTYSQNYIKKLQQHQKAPIKLKAISERNEGKQFLSLWNLDGALPESTYEQYNRLFVDTCKQSAQPGYLRKYYEHDDDAIEEIKQKLYVHPDYESGLGVFDVDDLNGFCLLVKPREESMVVFLWKAENWENNLEEQQNFVKKVIDQNYSEFNPEKIEVREEDQQNPSQEFMNCFS